MSRSSVSTEKKTLKGITTRKYRVGDVSQIMAIQEALIQKKVSKKWALMVKDHLRRPEGTGFVALKENRVVGFIIGEMKGAGFGIEQSGWIEVIGVHPGHMGVGIGQTLATNLFKFFKKRGIHDIYTAVRWDAVDMLSFFKSLGFDRSTFINLIKHLD
jgi:ribosomal protein S18 acetylase RimI-like enzyme